MKKSEKREKAFYWPLYFYQSLPEADQKRIPTELVTELQEANSCLWRALNIYDDFLDGSGNPEYLPKANHLYQKFLETYYRHNLPDDFFNLFDKILDDLNEANQREVISRPTDGQRRLSLKDLSKKSLALGLGPLAILASENKKMASRQTRAVLEFFRYALAAKQLSDDARDWREDMKNDKETIVSLAIRKELNKLEKNEKRDKEITVNLIFVQKISPQLIGQLHYLTIEARKKIKGANLKNADILINGLLRPIEIGIEEAKKFLTLLNKKTLPQRYPE